ncbi:PAAR domain-containing protein [Parashewanella tropica]|uniref:PAAR domain-containing protein n=1 Tax=Parashewanella tropica TaxID=2547970 RepID=UPI0010595495|nr:PAAR domain-containing protein [Parashewanella tropica]
MPMPASRATDMHICPMVTAIIPHVGGPLAPMPCTVLIGNMPAATMTQMCVCVGPPDTIIKGSMTVLISNMPGTRLGDTSGHGANTILGWPTVLMGD